MQTDEGEILEEGSPKVSEVNATVLEEQKLAWLQWGGTWSEHRLVVVYFNKYLYADIYYLLSWRYLKN